MRLNIPNLCARARRPRFSSHFLIGVSLLVGLVTACTNLPSGNIPSSPKKTAFEDHIQMVSEQWRYPFYRAGRFSVQYEENRLQKSEQVSFEWRETDMNHITIALSDPIGGMLAQLDFNGETTTLVRANGQVIEGKNPDDLLKNATGLELPVTGLRYWLRGVPRPHQPYTINPKENFGWIQDDWYVTVQQFLPPTDSLAALPKGLVIHRMHPKLDIKLVIQDPQRIAD